MNTYRIVLHDVRLQFRQGFYAAYAFVAIVYIVLLRALPEDIRQVALAPLLLSEASVIGFIFAGTLLQLERAEGVLQSLAVMPLSPAAYLFSKAASLALLTVLVALGIAWGVGDIGFAPLPLIIAALLTSMIFTAGGIAVASRFETLDRFVIWGGLISAPFALPILPYLGITDSPLWIVLPTQPALTLLATGFGVTHANQFPILEVVMLLGWLAPTFYYAHRWFNQLGLARAPE